MSDHKAFFNIFNQTFNIQDFDFFLFSLDLCEKFHINTNLVSLYLTNSQYEEPDFFSKSVQKIKIEDSFYFVKDMFIFGKEIYCGWASSLEFKDQEILEIFVKNNPKYKILNGSEIL